jgi:hypothetical protein
MKHEARAPTPAELQSLLVKIITHLMQMLTLHGHLIEGQGMTYMAHIGPITTLPPLKAGRRQRPGLLARHKQFRDIFALLSVSTVYLLLNNSCTAISESHCPRAGPGSILVCS